MTDVIHSACLYIAVVCEHSAFYLQVSEMLSDMGAILKRCSSRSELGNCHMIVTDGTSSFPYEEGIPVFVIAQKKPGTMPKKASVSFFQSGKSFQKEVFRAYVAEWADVIRELADSEEQIGSLNEQLKERRDQVCEYRQSLKLSRKLQEACFIPSVPDGYEIGCYYQPASIISGDFCVLRKIGKRLFVIVGDVVDHGMQAGLYAATLQAMMHSYFSICKENSNLLSLLEFLRENRCVCNLNDNPYTATAMFLEIDEERNTAKFLDCGHPLPVLVQDGEVSPVAFDKPDIVPPLGERTTALPQRGAKEVPFHPGDMVLLYTDGITEVFRAGDETKDFMRVYSSDRLMSSVAHEIKKPGWTAAKVVSGVVGDIESYSIGEALPDDATLLAIRYLPHRKSGGRL